jgi:hypothetical protein
MATGSGKTTVMGMIAAWSILNKVHDRSNARYSDVVLVVCPNVTIRSRLAELDPRLGDASLYRKSDLVPPHLMPDLTPCPHHELARVRTSDIPSRRRQRTCRESRPPGDSSVNCPYRSEDDHGTRTEVSDERGIQSSGIPWHD